MQSTFMESLIRISNDGTGTYSVFSTLADQLGATALTAGDWDGDGNLDLAAADNGSDSVHILDNQP